MLRRFIVALVCCFALQAQAAPTDDAALHEIADALIQKGADGKAYGSLYYRSLPLTADGARVIRLYTKPYARVVGLVRRSLWYELVDTQAVRPTVQQWALDVYAREFPQLRFELTDDAAQANLFMVEARFVPNTYSGKVRPADTYYKVAANSMNASIGGRRSAIININSGGNPWLAKLIAADEGATVRATLLNEMFNGFSISDFQDLNVQALSPATQAWLAVHRTSIDDYTITRSGGPREDEHLKPLDRLIAEKLLLP